MWTCHIFQQFHFIFFLRRKWNISYRKSEYELIWLKCAFSKIYTFSFLRENSAERELPAKESEVRIRSLMSFYFYFSIYWNIYLHKNKRIFFQVNGRWKWSSLQAKITRPKKTLSAKWLPTQFWIWFMLDNEKMFKVK